MRIYAGNLPYDLTEEDVRKEFEAFGEVTSVALPRDGRAKGFGFVEMPSKIEAETAIAGLNGKMIKERAITVSEARPRAEAGAGAGGGGGARGGVGRGARSPGGFGGGGGSGGRSGGPRRY